MGKEHNKIDVKKINEMAKNDKQGLIDFAEKQYDNELENAVNIITQHKSCTFLLVSGPSGSTKTTTSHKLSQKLARHGLHTAVVSLDDFFIDRNNLPVLSNGETDYESVRTLDTKTLWRCFDELLNKREAELPIFDFKSGTRSKETNKIIMESNTIIIAEGIHALNPALLEGLSKESYLKLYISPHSDYFDGEEMVLSSRNTRLIRRMVRDYFYRGNSIKNTLLMWNNVVKSEVENIIPFRDSADITIDSTVCYEPCLYHQYSNILSPCDELSDVQNSRVSDLAAMLSRFEEITLSEIPKDSVLWEFLQ